MMQEGDTAYTVEEKDGDIGRIHKWRVGNIVPTLGFKLTCTDGVESFSNLTSTFSKEGVEQLIDRKIEKLEAKIQLLKLLKKTQL